MKQIPKEEQIDLNSPVQIGKLVDYLSDELPKAKRQVELIEASIGFWKPRLAKIDRRQSAEDRRIARGVILTFTERRKAARRLSDRGAE